MALIAFLALDLAALRVASDGYVDLSRHLTVAMLAGATYLARHREGSGAAWWFGFALVGWSYIVLAIDATARRAPAVMISLKPLPPVTLLGLFMSDESLTGNSQALAKRWWNEFEILQSIFTLVMASLGGLVCWMWSGRRGTPYRQEEPRAGRLDLDDRAA
jgi:hypothetical protein